MKLHERWNTNVGNKEIASSSTPQVNSVLHATQILELYAAQRKEYMSLSEISRTLQMHKTTVYRILRTLQSVGWIEQSLTNGQYRLGTGILLISSAVAVHHTSRSLIAEEMQKLSRLHNETVVLSALLGNTGICVDMVKSRHSLSISSENGYIVPLEIGATGKMLLAAQAPQIIESILSGYPAPKAQQLRGQVEKIRQEGFCISEGEVDLGVAAVAVPLAMSDGIYALSISGPMDRLRLLGYEHLKNSLLQTVEAIQKKNNGLAL